jgi:hypothetical protein
LPARPGNCALLAGSYGQLFTMRPRWEEALVRRAMPPRRFPGSAEISGRPPGAHLGHLVTTPDHRSHTSRPGCPALAPRPASPSGRATRPRYPASPPRPLPAAE